MEKKALGRGLEALLPVNDGTTIVEKQNVIEVELEHILPNRYQPRREFPQEELQKLADSIRQSGLLQPVVVRRKGDGFYELIVGERRWRAAKLAGIQTVSAVVRNCTDEQAMVYALIENLQRHDLNPIETARAYQRMLSEFGLTQDQIADQVGKDRTSVANTARLVNLPSEIQRLVESGQISTGHAKVILGLTRSEEQVRLARQIVDGQFSVRHAEKVAGREFRTRKIRTRKIQESAYADLEQRMQKFLGTKVEITQKKRRGGRIVIHYFSQSELDRMVEMLLP